MPCRLRRFTASAEDGERADGGGFGGGLGSVATAAALAVCPAGCSWNSRRTRRPAGWS